MERILRWILRAVAVGLIVQTARPRFRYGDWLDATATFEYMGFMVPFGMGPIVTKVDAVIAGLN